MTAVSVDEYLSDLEERRSKQWPESVPRTLEYPHGTGLMTDYLAGWARERPDHPAINYYGREITYRELDELSDRFAGFLQREGLVPGDRVAVFMSNCPQFFITFYGVLKAGCVHVPINPMFKQAELAFELEDTEPLVLVTLPELLPLVESTRDPEVVRTVVVTALLDYAPAEPAVPLPAQLLQGVDEAPPQEVPGLVPFAETVAGERLQPVALDPDALAALNYTGGTTGMPKGCEHSQRHMVYTGACTAAGLGGTDVSHSSLVYIPMFWIAGEDEALVTPVFRGTTCILLNRWDPAAVLRAVDRYKPTAMLGTVENYMELLEQPDVDQYDLSSLTAARSMSFIQKLNVQIRRQWSERVGSHSLLREVAYGMTETHTMDTFTTGLQDGDRDLNAEPLFVGLPFPGTEVKVVDFATGDLLPIGEPGEIAIRTPSLFTAYWRRPDATAEAIRDGWFHTGDVGRIDDEGFLHLLGRRKEMLKVNGMSVFPSELEVLLSRHPAVTACGVIGVSDPEKGQVPVAFVTVADGAADADEAAITAWCRANMATYKLPRVFVVEALPLTTTGKVKKEDLRGLLPVND